MGCRFRETCRDFFKKLNILPLKSRYILSLIMFIVNNSDYFISTKDCHGANTRQSNNLHSPQVNLTVFKMVIYYSDVKIFNSLPLKVKEISHDHKKFKSKLKGFLYSYSFYTLEEFNRTTM
jgi:hypothetical protein